jgi:hypothetical protein
MSRYARYFRIAFSAFCGLACALLVLLWVRSYWWVDEFELRTTARRFLISSAIGEAELEIINSVGRDSSWEYSCRLLDGPNWEYRRHRIYHNTIFGFGIETDPDLGNYNVLAPLWFLSASAIVCAILPWVHKLKWRFSLRTLLIEVLSIVVF